MKRHPLKRKLTVTTEYGTFHRTTANAYTHILIECGMDPERITANYNAYRKEQERNRATYQAIVDNLSYTEDHRATYRNWLAGAEKALEEMPANLAAALAKNQKRIDTKDGGVISWHSSRALALQAATSARLRGRHVHVIEIPAEEEAAQ